MNCITNQKTCADCTQFFICTPLPTHGECISTTSRVKLKQRHSNYPACESLIETFCSYCQDAGEIETDNNGPITPCPVCSNNRNQPC